jgi:hypothetical protein
MSEREAAELKAQLLGLIDVISDPEVLAASARTMAMTLGALMGVGFTRDEAIQLLVAREMSSKGK